MCGSWRIDLMSPDVSTELFFGAVSEKRDAAHRLFEAVWLPTAKQPDITARSIYSQEPFQRIILPNGIHGYE